MRLDDSGRVFVAALLFALLSTLLAILVHQGFGVGVLDWTPALFMTFAAVITLWCRPRKAPVESLGLVAALVRQVHEGTLASSRSGGGSGKGCRWRMGSSHSYELELGQGDSLWIWKETGEGERYNPYRTGDRRHGSYVIRLSHVDPAFSGSSGISDEDLRRAGRPWVAALLIETFHLATQQNSDTD